MNMLKMNPASLRARVRLLSGNFFQSHAQPRRCISIITKMRQQSWSQQPGCFGVPGLHRAEDWDVLAKECIRDCLSLAESIRSQASSPTPALLQTFDDLSDRLCSVLDVAELCRNVHPDPEFVDGANEAYLRVSSIIQELNADETIYEPIKILYDRHEQTHSSSHQNKLSEEDAIMVKSLKDDFESGGIHLPHNKKAQMIKLQQQLNTLSSQFVSIDDELDTAYSKIHVEEDKLRSLPEHIRSQLNVQKSHSGKHKQSGYVEISLTPSKAHLLLKWCRQSSIREQVYHKLYNGDSLKSQTLDNILLKRNKIAGILGRNSYAEMMFSNRLASSPSDVIEFLNQFSHMLKEPATQERLSIEREKQRNEPDTTVDGNTTVHAWDQKYYIGRIKAEQFNLSSAGLSRYFPLQTCLTALSEIVRNVFGIRLLPAEHSSSCERWHSDVQKFQMIDERNNNQLLGHIFLDLYPRPGKYSHAAHFSIRCGRQPANKTEYQTPIVALVCNFGSQSSSGQRLLTLPEYETLFHEFGHSLHSVLSRTRYQHLSGTRVATDMVEVPSHVFENFAWDPRILSRYAKHCETGDEMPTRIVKGLCASRTGFAATDMQTQLLFSAMDLQFHGPNPPLGTTDIEFNKLQRQLTVLQPDEGISVPATFHHFITYGAGYYSYVFARILSAQIWANLFENDPFSRSGGDVFRHKFLALGAARSSSSLISNVISGDATCDAFIDRMGLRSSSRSSSLHLPISSRGSTSD